VKAKLERARGVVVKSLGYKDEDVSLRNAAVSSLDSSECIVQFLISLIAGRKVGVVVGRTSCGTAERSGSCSRVVADWSSPFAWSEF
jgi:hypothetical protein